jgi:hypothetical protein
MDDPVSASSPHSRFSPLSFLGGFGFGAFVGVGLALLVFFLVKDDSSKRRLVAVPVAVDAPDAAPAQVTPTPDTRPRTKVGLDVRLGPGESFGLIGLLSKGEAVTPVGRDANATWLAIQFPPGSAGRGWVPVGQLDNVTGADLLAVVLPTPLPRTISPFPTAAPSLGQGPASAATTTSIAVTATASANQGPQDLIVTGISLLPDGRVAVTIGNRGPGDLVNQAVFVLVRNLALQSEQVVAPAGSLKAGATITVQTASFRVVQTQEVIAVADPYATINDPDRSNNTLQVTLSPPRTPTPTVVPFGSNGG